MTEVADFTPWLREAIAEAKDAGLVEAAAKLEARAFAAYTTSSEWLGETRLGIEDFCRESKDALPASVESRLRACLKEIRKVWP